MGRKTPIKKITKSPGKRVSDEVIAIDLFAGAGGFSIGAYNADIKVAAAIEWDRYACATYRNNLIKTGLTKTTLFEGDINELDPQDVKVKSGLDKKHCDILLGGPPCQGFSAHRLNNSGVDDPRNKLLLRYFEYVRIIRPTFFLVENVPGLLWPKHKPFVEAFCSLAESAKYGVLEPIVLNARDYGVPQNRRRVFILGYDKNVTGIPACWPPKPTHQSTTADGDLPHWRTAATVFKKRALKGDINNVHMNHGPELIATFKKTPVNGGSRKDSGRILPCHEGHVGHHDVYGRIDPSQPAPTMTTACINPSKGRFVHPTLHHGITLRQAARIQSFPEWFTFEGGIMAGGMQVGNAVPVDLATALLENLKTAVLALRAEDDVSAAA